MILIIGATSATGRELVRQLREAGEPPRILSRTDTGTDIVRGDLADPSSLDAAMSGVDRVFLLSSPHPDEVKLHRNAIDAAARSGVRHLVRSSLIDADSASPWTWSRNHGEADDYLVASGVPYTILRPNFYLHTVGWWTRRLGPNGEHHIPDSGTGRISGVDVRDIAAVAARVLTEDGHVGRVYRLTGPEAFTVEEATERLSRHAGVPIVHVPMDDATTRAALLGAGMGTWYVEALVELFQSYRASGPDGFAAEMTDVVERITGRPPRTLEDALSA